MEQVIVNHELQQRVNELSALNIFMQKVNSNLSLEQVIQAVIDGINSVLNPDLITLFLLQDGNLLLQGFYTTQPEYDIDKKEPHKIDECLCGMAAKTGKPIYTNDIHNDPRCTRTECKDADLKSFAALPLLKDDKIIGVLGLSSEANDRDFKKQEDFLEILSNGVAIGIQNAILYKETNENRDELIKTNKILKKEINERIKTEQAFKESNRLLEGTFLSINELVMVVDKSTRKIVSCNRRIEDIFGYKIEEVVGVTIEFLHLNQSMFEKFGQMLYPALEADRVFHTSFKMKKKDGSIIYTEHTVNEIVADHGPANKLVSVIRDITEHKKAEDALRQSEAGLAEAQRIARLGNWDWDLETNQLRWSNEVYRIFGVSQQSFTPTYDAILNFIHQEDREAVSHAVNNAINKNIPYGIEYRIVLPQDSICVVHEQVEVVQDYSGKAIKIMGTVQDVTARKNTEEALKTKNSFLRLLQVAAVSANGAYEIKKAFKPILTEVCRHTGWPIGHAYLRSKENRNLLEPTTIWHLQKPKKFTLFKDVTEKTTFKKGIGLPGGVLASGKPQWVIDVTKASNFPRTEPAKATGIKSGFAFPVMIGKEVVAVLEFFGTEAVMPDKVFLEIMADVGTELGRVVERKRAQTDMNYLRNLLKNVIDSMPSVIVTVDYNGKIMQWNRDAEKHTGLPMNKARGCKLTDTFADLSIKIDEIQQVIQSRTQKKKEKLLTKTDGETKFSDVTIYPLIANGVEGAVIRIDDVTERVRMEEMMIQSDKMLSVGGLAAGMAHEINNPLAGIIQSIQVLLDRTVYDLPANHKVAQDCKTEFSTIKDYMNKREIISIIEAIRSSGERAAKIVENMLSFSRKSISEFKPHDPRELLDKTLELSSNDYDLKKKFDFRKIKIERQYATTLPLINCEETKIQQVLFNLLKNGAQAMVKPKDKNVQPKFIIRTLFDNDMVRIEVEDNGPGMDETTSKRVFEPFFSTKDVGDGTGLGMYISYFIITENHRGSMTVESELGKGTKFVIRLPACEA